MVMIKRLGEILTRKMAESSLKVLLYIIFICASTQIWNVQTSTHTWNVRPMNNTKVSCDYNKFTKKLIIQRGFIEKDVTKCFETYPETEILVFRNSRLKTIPPYLGLLKNLISLDLSYNDIISVSFTGFEQICKRIKHLVLNHNDVRELRKGNLDCLESLEKLYMANNRLELIENGTFNTKLKAIDYVHLVNNSLTAIDSSLCSKLLLSSNVTIIVNASYNNIKEITNSANITINDFTISSTIGLFLLHNNITRINITYYFNMFNVTHPFPQLLRLGSSGFEARFNPFICDCELYPLAMALRQFYRMDPDNPVFSITCGTPISLDGMMVRKVPREQFNCSITQHCPKSCTCIKTIALDLITIDCNNGYNDTDLPKTCPAASKIQINMKSNQITKLSARPYLRNVTVLDVSQCSIASIDSSFIKALEGGISRSVYLNDNNLKNIPESFKKFNFSKVQILTLNGNPFTCDCHSLWLKKWILSNKKHIIHQDKIKCASGHDSGKPIIDVPDNEFTCETGPTISSVIYITTASFIGFIFLAFIIACKINSIQVFMMTNFGLCKYCFRARKQRRLKYDIFIPHSCEDDVMIDNIVTFLEHQTSPYKVCLAERDFEIGKTITENILDSIESSHTTLLVVSNNFLKSAWCNMEFREAHMRFLRDRNINMVLIVLEELDDDLIYNELRKYLRTHVYLKYTDRYFWAKLLQNIPIMIISDTETDPLIQN